jgi:hypothetical protein
MDKLANEVALAAARAVSISKDRNGTPLDFSEASLALVEEMLEECSAAVDEMTPKQLEMLVEDFGCYILEVGRKEFGGRYYWFDQREQPVLVVGEPAFRVAMITWDKVRGRLKGDKADNIPFFYAGFAQRARQAKPGDDALYV